MKLMKQKLLVTDLDGTLIPVANKISAANIEAARKACEKGITVAIATGRMYRASLPVADALGIDTPIIAYNGAMIARRDGTVLYDCCLPSDTAAEVIALCRDRGWHLQLYARDELYYAAANEFTERYERNQSLQGHAVGWEGLQARTENVTKLLCISAEPAEAQQKQEILRAAFGDKLNCMVSHPRYVEMVDLSVGKGLAVKRLAEKLGIDRENVFAIGDSVNDISMLQAAGVSIAMGNAAPEIRAMCTHVTSPCDEDGFAHAILNYVL